MNDKQMLELAAKANGGLAYVDDMGWIHEDAQGNRGAWWHPLTDDGDRYRLAKKLGFVVDFELQTVGVDIKGESHLFQWGGKLDEAHAFVLAAAEIGKAL